MQYINPYELLNVENNIPQNPLVKQEDKEASKAQLALEIIEEHIANGITDLKGILHECAKKAGLEDVGDLPIGYKHLIERVFRNYNQNKAAGINNTIITKAQNKIKISDCNPDIISTIIRKQKAALFREIDLNREDNGIGSVDFRGMQLTKADCIKPIDDLDDENKNDFHLFIYQNKMLNDFLTDGDLTFFNNYKVESIYKLPAFIDFISPFFAEQYNRKLCEYFEKWNKSEVSKILSICPVVNSEFIDRCYSNVHLFLRSLENDINKQQEEVAENNNVINSASLSIDPSLINLLPSLHFQNIRNKIGGSIKSLAVVINNIGIDKPDDEAIKWLKVSFHMIAMAKEIDCTGVDEMRIRDNYFILKNNFDNVQERIEEEKRKNEYKISPSISSNIQRISSNVKELESQRNGNDNLTEYKTNAKNLYSLFQELF